MGEPRSWNELRDRRMEGPAAKTGYEQAKAAYEVGRMIRELREARQLSQRELAERMGTTQSVVGRLEAGGSRPTLLGWRTSGPKPRALTAAMWSPCARRRASSIPLVMRRVFE